MAQNPPEILTRAQQARLMRAASVYAVLTAVLLVLIKFLAWRYTDSLAMLSSLMDSVLDVGMSAVNFFAVRAALIPADREHRFGHGKAEALAALAQALFIVVSSILLVGESVERFYIPHAVSGEAMAIAAMIVSMVLTFLLVMFQNHVVRKTGSIAIASDRAHYKTDMAINFSVLVAMALIWQTGIDQIDAALGGVVALYLVWSGRKILSAAIDVLLDRELPDDVLAAVESIIRADPDVVDFHDLRSRAAGPHYFIQFHLELDGNMTLAASHHIADRIEHAIMAAYPQAQVSIHQEPAGINDHRDNFT